MLRIIIAPHEQIVVVPAPRLNLKVFPNVGFLKIVNRRRELAPKRLRCCELAASSLDVNPQTRLLTSLKPVPIFPARPYSLEVAHPADRATKQKLR